MKRPKSVEAYFESLPPEQRPPRRPKRGHPYQVFGEGAGAAAMTIDGSA